MPAVSVLVPCYNVEKYIRQCMDSIVNQTLRDMEIICINDGSTDSTLAILQEYAAYDSRVVIIDKSNSGYGDSMNKGLERATGEYIGIIESDDWVELDMFECLYSMALEHDCDMVKSGYYLYWSAPQERHELIAAPQEYTDRLLLDEDYADCTIFAPSIWSAVYRREMLERWDIHFLTTPGASYQDTSFYIKTWICSRSIYISSKAWLWYRQDNMNSSVKSKNKIFAIVHEYRSVEDFIKKWALNQRWHSIKNKMKFSGYVWNFNRLNYAGRKRFLPIMQKDFRDILNSCTLSLFNEHDLHILRQVSHFPNYFLLKASFLEWIKNNKQILKNLPFIDSLLPIGSRRREFVKKVVKNLYYRIR